MQFFFSFFVWDKQQTKICSKMWEVHVHFLETHSFESIEFLGGE